MVTMRAMIVSLQISELTETKFSYFVTLTSFDILKERVMFFHFG